MADAKWRALPESGNALCKRWCVSRSSKGATLNWRAWFGLDRERNPYLRLSEADRYALGVKWLLWFLGVALFFWVLTRLGWRTG